MPRKPVEGDSRMALVMRCARRVGLRIVKGRDTGPILPGGTFVLLFETV